MASEKQISASCLNIITVLIISISCLFLPVSSIPLLRNWKSLATIKEVNQKGPYLGLITVYPPEEDAFFAIGAFKPDPRHPYVDISGFYITFFFKILEPNMA